MLLSFEDGNSTLIDKVWYDTDGKFLVVKFLGGELYTFSDVPKRIYDDFSSALSKGKYFGENIKSAYSTKKQ